MSTTRTEAVDKALAERERQHRRYLALKRAEYDRLYGDPEYGDKLRKFGATLNHFGIGDGDAMVEYVARSAKSWLRQAPPGFRAAALHLISERGIRIRIRNGLPPLDDPLPGEPDDVFRLCRKELRL